MSLLLKDKAFLIIDTTSHPTSTVWPRVPTATLGMGWTIWIKPPATVSAPMVIFDYTNGVDSSQVKVTLRTDLKLDIFGSTSTGTSGTVTTTTALTAEEFNHFSLARESNIKTITYKINDGTNTTGISLANAYDTAFTKLSIGRGADGNDPCDGVELAWFAVVNDEFSVAENTALYNGGLMKNPAAAVNSEIAIYPFRNDRYPIVGSGELVSGIELTWADDDEWTDPTQWPDAWEAPAIQLVPPSRNCHLIYDNGNQDFIMVGDSLGESATPRMSHHFFNKLAVALGCQINKFFSGASSQGAVSGNLIVSTFTATGAIRVAVSTANNYLFDNQTTPDAMALPIGEGCSDIYYPDGAVSGTYMMTVQTQNYTLYPGGISAWLGATDPVLFTPILRRGFNYQVFDGDTYVGDITYSSPNGVTGVNPQTPVLVSEVLSGIRTLKIGPPGGSWANVSNEYFQPLGYVVENVNRPTGMGFGLVTDQSWSVDGHNVDATSGTNQIKEYSNAEFNGLLSAFRKPGKQLVFVLNINNELIDDMSVTVPDWISRTNERCALLGITNHRFLLISQYTQASDATYTSHYDMREESEAAVVLFDQIARDNPTKVAHVSLYKTTRGGWFREQVGAIDPCDANGPQQQFLVDYDAANGTSFVTSPGRNMMNDTVHLLNSASASAMATFITKEIALHASPEPSADSASSFGIDTGISISVDMGIDMSVL